MNIAKEKKLYLNIPVILLMAGLFFALLFNALQYQGENKSSVMFYATGCLMTMSGIMVLSICYGVGNYGRNKIRNCAYQLLLFFTFLGTFFGGLCFVQYNMPGGFSLAMLFLSLEGCTTDVVIFLLCAHDQTYFDIPKKTGRLLLTVPLVIMLSIIVILILNNLTPFALVVIDNSTIEYSPVGVGIWITFMLCLAFYALLSAFFVKNKRTRFFLALNKTGPILWVVFEVLPYYGMEVSLSFLSNFSSFLTLLLMFSFVYIEDNKKMAQQERELSSLRLSSIRAQMDPHLVYNTLGTIADMCNTDPKEAEELIYLFSDYLRDNFSDVERQPMLLFSEEMKHVRNYVMIEQKRFPDIDVKYDLKARDFMIPAMTLQPVIENSIKHGICSRRKSKGLITIMSEEREYDFAVTVEDDGVGFDTKAIPSPEKEGKDHRHGIGLQNTKKRLELMCGGTLAIKSEPGKGTVCLITIPKEKYETGEET